MTAPGEKNTHQDPQTTAQLEKVQLEIADLKWKVRWVYKMAQIISIISACIAVAAFLISLRQFNYQQEQETKKPVRERQLSLIFEISDVAARIATLMPEDEDRKRAEKRFWQLYWGPIVFVEDRDLQEQIVDFGKCLDQGTRADVGCGLAEQQEKRLKELSLTLAVKRRDSLGVAWDIKFEDIYNTRAQSTPTPFSLP